MGETKKKKAKKETRGCNGKYSADLRDAIAELVQYTDLTNKEICDQVEISEDSYYRYLKLHSDFSEAINKAQKERLIIMKDLARQKAFQKLKGFDSKDIVEEYEKDENGELVLKAKKVTVKHNEPSDTFVMYTLNNTDPENFKHKSHLDHTTKDKALPDLSGLTTEELIERAKAAKTLEE